MTAQNKTVVWDAAYEPFGKINEYTTQSITNNFRFPGQYEDAMTGMYYNHHRYYMPGLGRYNRVDPYRQYFITYDYVYNNPPRYIDPKGLEIALKPPPKPWLYVIEGGSGSTSITTYIRIGGGIAGIMTGLLWPSDVGVGTSLGLIQWGLGNQNGLNNVILGPWPNPPGSPASQTGGGDQPPPTQCRLYDEQPAIDECFKYCKYICDNGTYAFRYQSRDQACEPYYTNWSP